jgi:hypothetical protein
MSTSLEICSMDRGVRRHWFPSLYAWSLDCLKSIVSQTLQSQTG